MDKLPVELLQRIADHLDSSTSTEGRSALSSFARTSKQHYQALTPNLYRDVRLETREEAFLWARTCFGRVPLRCLPSGPERAWADKIAVRSLSFDRDDGKRHRPGIKGSTIPTFLAYVDVPDLRPGLACGTFNFLKSLSLRNFSIHPHVLVELLGPFKPLRMQLKKLELHSEEGYGHFTLGPVTFFLFQALDYLGPELYSKAVKASFDELTTSDPDWVARCMHALQSDRPDCSFRRVTATPEQLRLASVDYFSFLAIFKEDPVNLEPLNLPSMIFSVPAPPTLSPFSSLIHLVFQRDGMEELYLVFYTPLFPKLKTLTILDTGGTVWQFDKLLLSTFRRSITHESPGTITPPYPENDLEDEAAQISWAPLSAEELEAYPLKPYRGPLLDVLDLSDWMWPYEDM